MVSHRRKMNSILSASCLLPSIFFLYILLLCSCCVDCYATDTLKHGQWITDNGTTLVSSGGTFELGFFNATGSGSPKRFVGIWYSKQEYQQTVVWVANSDKPVVNGSTGVSFGIADNGNLEIWDTTGKKYWSTKIPDSSSTSRTVKLMDSGNLVLSDNDDLWSSFKYPTDTFLPGMKMDESLTLTSWIDDGDPGIGNFTFKQDQEGKGHYVISKETKPLAYWRSWMSGNFLSSDEMPITIAKFLSNSDSPLCLKNNMYVKCGNYSVSESYRRLVMNYTGELQYYVSRDQGNWALIWREPEDECSIYNACGNFSCCNINNRPFVCKCLPGFQRNNSKNWNSGDLLDGCTRNWISTDKSDMFLSLKMMKVSNPDSDMDVKDETECRKACLENSTCQAYSYGVPQSSERGGDSTTGTDKCWIWSSELSNLQEEYTYGGRNLSVRVAKSVIVLDSKVADNREDQSNPAKMQQLSKGSSIMQSQIVETPICDCTAADAEKKRNVAAAKETEKENEVAPKSGIQICTTVPNVGKESLTKERRNTAAACLLCHDKNKSLDQEGKKQFRCLGNHIPRLMELS